MFWPVFGLMYLVYVSVEGAIKMRLPAIALTLLLLSSVQAETAPSPAVPPAQPAAKEAIPPVNPPANNVVQGPNVPPLAPTPPVAPAAPPVPAGPEPEFQKIEARSVPIVQVR